jgi:hypothetical protein
MLVLTGRRRRRDEEEKEGRRISQVEVINLGNTASTSDALPFRRAYAQLLHNLHKTNTFSLFFSERYLLLSFRRTRGDLAVHMHSS